MGGRAAQYPLCCQLSFVGHFPAALTIVTLTFLSISIPAFCPPFPPLLPHPLLSFSPLHSLHPCLV